MTSRNWTFFISVLAIALTSGCSTLTTNDDNPSSAEFVSIFDGKTLDGWHTVPDGCLSEWTVEDGIIVGQGSYGCLSYLLFDDVELTDFELEASYRFPGKGNSGISIHAEEDSSGKRRLVGYHADLGHLGIGPQVLGAWDFHFATREEYACFRGTSLVINPDGSTQRTNIEDAVQVEDINRNDWNKVRVVAQGRHYQFFINGKLSSEFTDNAVQGRQDKGAIALQVHDPRMRVEFRDLRLKNTAAQKQ